MDPHSDDSGFEEEGDTAAKVPLPRAPHAPVATTPADVIPVLAVQPLTGYGCSLAPDMHFGWRPKLAPGGPIPLLFDKAELPVVKNTFGEEPEVVYHGFRPKDTFALHREFAGADSYPVPSYPTLQVYNFLRKNNRETKDLRPFTGVCPTLGAEDLRFDSTFESGNLDKAVRVRHAEYDLYMRTDANTRGHHQWFYFSAIAGKLGEARFHILNFTKSESLYSQGMLPFIFDDAEPEKGWRPGGHSPIYRPSKLNSYVRRCYFSLSFSYSFEHSGTKVYFAYSIPYTYTRLLKVARELVTSGGELRVKREVLCRSLGGVDVPVITVTDFSVPQQRKRGVVVTGRVHPGETFGSFMLEGFLRLLLSDSHYSRHLLQRLVFHIVPMLNPDGVIMGNYRTGFAGNDLNRQFQRPDYILHPTVVAVKALIARVWKQQELVAFLDLHAHSKQKSVFLYGPHFPLHSDKYEKTRILPKLICARSPLFRFAACKFRNERSKRKAARLVIWKEFKVATSYTVEASFYGYLAPDRSTAPFTEDLIKSAGAAIAEGLWDFLQHEDRETEAREAKRRKSKARKTKTSLDGLVRVQESPSTAAAIPDANTEDLPALDSLSDPQSSSSDGDSSEDDLEAADAAFLHQEIAAVLQDFSDLTTPQKREKRLRTKRQKERVTPQPQELEVKSSLEPYFSRAEDLIPRRLSVKPVSKALVPKVYDPLLPIRPPKGLRSVSQHCIEYFQHHRSSADHYNPQSLAAEMSARLWRPPHTARRLVLDDDCGEAVDFRLITPAPRHTKAFRGDTSDRRKRLYRETPEL